MWNGLLSKRSQRDRHCHRHAEEKKNMKWYRKLWHNEYIILNILRDWIIVNINRIKRMIVYNNRMKHNFIHIWWYIILEILKNWKLLLVKSRYNRLEILWINRYVVRHTCIVADVEYTFHVSTIISVSSKPIFVCGKAVKLFAKYRLGNYV